MVALLNQIQTPRRRPNLLLHCGAHAVEREVVMDVPTPWPTDTWNPIAHIALVANVETTLRTNGLVVGNHPPGTTQWPLLGISRLDDLPLEKNKITNRDCHSVK